MRKYGSQIQIYILMDDIDFDIAGGIAINEVT